MKKGKIISYNKVPSPVEDRSQEEITKERQKNRESLIQKLLDRPQADKVSKDE